MWCQENDLDSIYAHPGQLADFFLFLHEIKILATVTIKGYRSAIARVYRLCQLPDPDAGEQLHAYLVFQDCVPAHPGDRWPC